jgi:hypothetical protein
MLFHAPPDIQVDAFDAVVADLQKCGGPSASKRSQEHQLGMNLQELATNLRFLRQPPVFVAGMIAGLRRSGAVLIDTWLPA